MCSQVSRPGIRKLRGLSAQSGCRSPTRAVSARDKCARNVQGWLGSSLAADDDFMWIGE